MPFDAVAKIVHRKGGEVPQLVEAPDVSASDAGIAPMLPVERDFPRAFHLSPEALILKRAQLLARHRIYGFEVFGSGRKFPPQALEVEGAVIARNAVVEVASYVSYTETVYRLLKHARIDVGGQRSPPNNGMMRRHRPSRARRHVHRRRQFAAAAHSGRQAARARRGR
jgi:hypothetical protein